MTTIKDMYPNFILIILLLVCIAVDSYLLYTTTKGIEVKLVGVVAICTCAIAIYLNGLSINAKRDLIESEKRIAILSAEIKDDIQKMKEEGL